MAAAPSADQGSGGTRLGESPGGGFSDAAGAAADTAPATAANVDAGPSVPASTAGTGTATAAKPRKRKRAPRKKAAAAATAPATSAALPGNTLPNPTPNQTQLNLTQPAHESPEFAQFSTHYFGEEWAASRDHDDDDDEAVHYSNRYFEDEWASSRGHGDGALMLGVAVPSRFPTPDNSAQRAGGASDDAAGDNQGEGTKREEGKDAFSGVWNGEMMRDGWKQNERIEAENMSYEGRTGGWFK